MVDKVLLLALLSSVISGCRSGLFPVNHLSSWQFDSLPYMSHRSSVTSVEGAAVVAQDERVVREAVAEPGPRPWQAGIYRQPHSFNLA